MPMRRLSLGELESALAERGLLAGPPGPSPAGWAFSEICFDPGPVRSGALYVNLHGDSGIARERLAYAASVGARAALCEFQPPPGLAIPALRVTHPRRALSAAACALAGDPAASLRVIGITGTNGKSTTANMLARVLDTAGLPHALLSSTCIRAGDAFFVPELMTTLDAPELHRLLRHGVDSGAAHAVVEVSSHGLAHERVADVRFDQALITNIGVDHTDFHPDPEDYLRTKARLFQGLAPGGLAVVNSDDALALRAAAGTRARVVRLGRGAEAEARLGPGLLHIGPRAADALGRPPVGLRLALLVPGPHNEMNAAFAALAAYAAGVEPQAIESGLATFPGLWRRLQPVYEGDLRVIDDIACNPGHWETAFDWLRSVGDSYRSLVVLTNPRGSRGVAMNRMLGELLARRLPALKLKRMVVSECDGLLGEFTRILPEEAAAYREGLQPLGPRVRWHRENGPAIREALRHAGRGDLLAIMGTHGVCAAAPEIQRRLQARLRLPWRRPFAERYHPTDALAWARHAVLAAPAQAVWKPK